MAESIEIQITKVLDEYTDEVVKVTNKAIQKVTKQAVQQLREKSPKRSGDYAGGWQSKVVETSFGGIQARTIYNAKKPGLTQLLEKGHIIKNKYGVQKRRNGSGNETDAHEHIKPVEEWANKALEAEIERGLS